MEGELDALQPLDSRQFHIAVRRLADSLLFGTDRSPFLGSGIDYVQSRPYAAGDPIRSMDWRVLARTGRPYVKEYEAPKQMPCWILLDTSASMVVGSGKRTKYATALHIAGGLAYACLERASPVGILGVGQRALRAEPSLSREQVLQWLLQLRRFAYGERTQLVRRAEELSARLFSRALIFVLSDLHEEGAAGVLRLLAQRHEVVVIRLRDPAEVSLAGAGFLRAREAETGKDFVTRGAGDWIDFEAQERALRQAGVDLFTVETDQPFAQRLRRFCAARGVFGRGAR